MNRIISEKPLIYVALGDSLSVGIGAILKPGFVKRYAKMAEHTLGRKVIPFVFARHGSTSGDLLKKLDEPIVKLILREAEIITISTGGNDLRKAAKLYLKNNDSGVVKKALEQYNLNIKSILLKIDFIKRRRKTPYIIRLVDVYNPMPDRTDAQMWVKRFQRELKALEEKNIKVTNIFEQFKGKEDQLMFIDKLHPNADGYQVIAEQLHKLGYGKLVRG